MKSDLSSLLNQLLETAHQMPKKKLRDALTLLEGYDMIGTRCPICERSLKHAQTCKLSRGIVELQTILRQPPGSNVRALKLRR